MNNQRRIKMDLIRKQFIRFVFFFFRNIKMKIFIVPIKMNNFHYNFAGLK